MEVLEPVPVARAWVFFFCTCADVWEYVHALLDISLKWLNMIESSTVMGKRVKENELVTQSQPLPPTSLTLPLPLSVVQYYLPLSVSPGRRCNRVDETDLH